MADSPEATLMRRFVKEVQQDGNFSKLEEFVDPQNGMKDHTGDPQASGGIEDSRRVLKWFHELIHDMTITIEHCIGADGMVATNKVVQGKLMQDFQGVTGKGQTVRCRVMDWVKVVNGKFTEHWALLGSVEEL